MLLASNGKKVVKFINDFDKLNNVEKLRVCIHTLESKFSKFNKYEITDMLKRILNDLDNSEKGKIVNFAKHKKLNIIASNYIVFNDNDKLRVIIEMLWSIGQSDFNDPTINKEIMDKLEIIDLIYIAVNNIDIGDSLPCVC